MLGDGRVRFGGRAGETDQDESLALRPGPTHHMVDRFNNRRLHRVCGDVPPAEYEQSYYRQITALEDLEAAEPSLHERGAVYARNYAGAITLATLLTWLPWSARHVLLPRRITPAMGVQAPREHTGRPSGAHLQWYAAGHARA